jgi:hypothetical protein
VVIKMAATRADGIVGTRSAARRNLAMDLQDAGCRARFLIRDRDP